MLFATGGWANISRAVFSDVFRGHGKSPREGWVMCENCTRRDFLGTSAAAGLMLAASSTVRRAQAAGERGNPSAGLPAKVPICVVFAGTPVPPDRGWGVCEAEIAAMERHLQDVERRLGNVQFVIGRANTAEEAQALLQRAGDDAPVLAINLSIGGLLRVSPPILDSQRALVVFSQPASGHDWMYPFRWRREGKPVTLLASSDWSELERAARLLRVIPLLKQSRVLVFEPFRGTPPACSPQQVKRRLGVDVVVVPQSRFDEVLAAVDADAAGAEAREWTEGALQIVEPSSDDVRKAARVSLALQHLVQQEQAQALAVGTCMGWLERGFPCLGFTRLRDQGIPASCEGDMDSLWTMLLLQYLEEIPGFQGNSTFDTARNVVWTAHCVGPTKMEGPDGEISPYLLRSHSEIGDGVVPEIQYRLDQEITRTKLVNLDTLLVSTGTIREVPEKSTRACRTQIVTEIGDAAKMARNWGGGVLDGDMMTLLHRVVYYGDHRQTLTHLADLMKMRVVEEG
jgi:hypothetical protein